MGQDSKIEWTEATWNPVSGCTRHSPGCDNCYAVKQTYRLEKMGQHKKYGGLTVLNGKGDRHFNGVVRTHDDALMIPLKWAAGRQIFVNSMSDLFHKNVPFEFVARVFATMALCPQHTFQVLTKRPDRMSECIRILFAGDASGRVDLAPNWYREVTRLLDAGEQGPLGKHWEKCHAAAENLDLAKPLPNVWLGASIENRAALDARAMALSACPAAVRFWSVEPLLEDLGNIRGYLEQNVNWVIVGGESGPHARPMHPDWVRSIRDQCQEKGVAFFFKQWGEWEPVSLIDAVTGRRLVNLTPGKNERLAGMLNFRRVGKKTAGRLLDGRTWDEMPGSGR